MSGSDSNSPTSIKPLTCEKCGTEIPILAQAQTRFVSCPKCGAYYEVSRSGNKFVKKFSGEHAGKSEPIWKLSTRIVLRETKYAVVGFVVKKEATENVYWREYYLFNPIKGYAYLAEYDGHWMLLQLATEHPKFGKHLHHNFSLGDHEYQLYHRYKAEVRHAQGEFYYDVTDVAACTEYVSPPHIFTREIRHKEVRWYKGEYLSPAEVAKASSETHALPTRIGVGACQPNYIRKGYQESLIISAFAFLLLLLIQGFLASSTKQEVVFRQSYTAQDSIEYNQYIPSKSIPIVTPSFTLANGTKNVEIGLYSPVDNNWFEAEMTLVSEKTGAEQDLNIGVEYYHGYDEGNWSEGSQTTEEVLSSVPEGVYHLVIVPVKPTKSALFQVTLKRDVPTWSNFWIVFGLLCLLPAIQYLRRHHFEKQRWMNSDFSPYDQ